MILFLVVLIFISKVALAFIPFVPWQMGPIIYQRGLHPYVNIFLTLSIGSLFIFKWLLNPEHKYAQSRFFRFGVVLISLYLVLITGLQAFFVNTQESFILQMAAAVLASFTIFLFGRIIPTSLTPEKFLKYIKNVTLVLCWFSLALLFLSSGTVFKGTRFIGIFKHIPHMVSAATLACYAVIYFFIQESHSKKRIIINSIHFLMAFFVLVLTGTRSALASVAMGLLLAAIIFPAKSNGIRILKTAFVITMVMGTLLFGEMAGTYAVGIATGQKAIAGRSAQDGVSSRIEEVERGYEIFKKNQWLGQGLLSKFSSGSEADVSNYSADKDPHNILISAGVIGGWGLIAMTTIFMLALLVAGLKSLKSKNAALKIIAIYTLSQIPLLIIYHLHFSIGGIADRIYWIVFGYMALKEQHVEVVETKKKTFKN